MGEACKCPECTRLAAIESRLEVIEAALEAFTWGDGWPDKKRRNMLEIGREKLQERTNIEEPGA